MLPSRDEISFLTVAHLARFLEPSLFGDLDMDGDVDVRDHISLAVRLGQEGIGPDASPATPLWNPLADLVPDGKIDGRDLAAFRTVR
jgi:hypothetical protein